MTNNFHDDLPTPFALTSSVFNKVFGQLDQGLTDLLAGNLSWMVRGSTPSTPASGKAKVYFKGAGFYTLDSGGVERNAFGGQAILVPFTELSGSQASIVIPVAASGFNHLILKLRARTDAAAVLDQVLIQPNGDTTAANYNTSAFDGVANNTAVGTVAGIKIWSVCGASADAGLFALVDPLLIYNYASTSRARQVDWTGVCIPSLSSATNYRVLSGGGQWGNVVDAMTSITLKPVAGSNFVAGTAYELLAVA